MENAGAVLARLARSRFLGGDPREKRVVVLAGTGGNGGGALVCARRLHNYGLYLADISVPPELYAQPALNLRVGHIFAESDIGSSAGLSLEPAYSVSSRGRSFQAAFNASLTGGNWPASSVTHLYRTL